MSENRPDVVLELNGIKKTFPGVVALADVSFDLRRGEVHAIVGENGAGKSTLIKILSGAYQQDAGTITFEDVQIHNMQPEKSAELGIHTIYQENTLIPYLTVAENIFLGQEVTGGKHGPIKWRKMFADAQSLIDRLHMNIDPYMLCVKLGIAGQQSVQIARALAHESKVVVMDEPTASFGKNEIDNLFSVIRTLKAEGASIIYISHHLDEVFQIADRITVLRDGQYIATFAQGEVNKKGLINNMVGRDISAHYDRERTQIGDDSFRVEGMTRAGVVDNVSFSARRGEILGIYGMVGAGRTELAQLIFGVDKADSGRVYLDGKDITPHSPEDAIASGLAFITEDRRKTGLVVCHNIEDNIITPSIRKIRGPVVRPKEVGRVGREMMDTLSIKAPSGRTPVASLSGGNQQKVVVAKWLHMDAQVYIFDEPTRGIDVGAKEEIYKICVDIAKQNKIIIFITSDMEELLSMSDRVLVMRNGQIGAELSKAEATQSSVLLESIGGEQIG